jgi:simple sugar transport system ATP-binding protein
VALLEARNVQKSFGKIAALRGVDFLVEEGEVVGLLGDNGAGKSTMIKILAGVHRPSGGEILWDGAPTRVSSPADAMRRGISVVYQDLAVVNQMSIYRNLFLGREAVVSRKIGPLRVLSIRRARAEARRLLTDLGLTVKSIDAPVATLSGGERQSIAIARAIHFESRLLILDEPTSALSLKESAKVGQYIDAARARGVSVIVITHNVSNIYPFLDRVVVLSLGKTVAHASRKDEDTPFPTPAEVADLILGSRIRQIVGDQREEGE